jgi:hypothetical protein
MKIRFKDKKHSFTAPELINILEEHGYDNAGYMVDCIMLAAENLSQYNMPFDWAGVVGQLYQHVFVRDLGAYHWFEDDIADNLQIVKAIYHIFIDEGIYIVKEA